MSEPLPEQIGKYPIIRELGRGATSVVYWARDPFANREVAIKVIRNQPAQDTDLRRRYRKVFLNEAALVGKLFHPHILTIYDAVSDDNLSYIVMEYVNGQTLEHYCDVANLLPVSKVVEIVFKCSLALAFAQRHGVIHCDIKPANILINDDTDIKISDFGAALYDDAEHTHLKGVGSPAYMSPEQVQDKEVSFHTDIYSLGVRDVPDAHRQAAVPRFQQGELAVSGRPHPAVPPSTFRREIPAELDRLVLRCLEKSAEARYPDLDRLLARADPLLPQPRDAGRHHLRHREVQHSEDAGVLQGLSRAGVVGDAADHQLAQVSRRPVHDSRGR